RDDAGAVFESEDAVGGVEFVFEGKEEALTEVVEVLAVGLADFAEEEAFEAGVALGIVSAHLGEEPVGFTAAAGATIADSGGAVGLVAETGGGAGGELAGLENDSGADEVFHLAGRATGEEAIAGVLVGVERVRHKWGRLRLRFGLGGGRGVNAFEGI